MKEEKTFEPALERLIDLSGFAAWEEWFPALEVYVQAQVAAALRSKDLYTGEVVAAKRRQSFEAGWDAARPPIDPGDSNALATVVRLSRLAKAMACAAHLVIHR